MIFQGKDIKEVWDYRLSYGVPQIVRRDTWQVEIYLKDNEGKSNAQPVQVYDTGLKTDHNDQWDKEKIIACYQWLYSVRDKYALPNINELKTLVKQINESNAKLSKLGAANGY